jgi:hypothetical protein
MGVRPGHGRRRPGLLELPEEETSRWRAGNIQGAEKASRMALIWGIVGIVVGLILFFAVIGSESGTGY